MRDRMSRTLSSLTHELLWCLPKRAVKVSVWSIFDSRGETTFSGSYQDVYGASRVWMLSRVLARHVINSPLVSLADLEPIRKDLLTLHTSSPSGGLFME